MKLRFALTALTCSSFYKELRSAPATNPNTNSNGFSQKFETGNFPEFPKVEDMFNIVDRYTAVVYDNMKHQANLYKNEISDMKSDLEEFKKGMNGEQKDVRKVLDGQSKVIEEQRVEIESLKGMLLGTASGLADSSDENTPKTSTSILDRISSMETTYSTKLSNQGKLLLNTVVNFKKLIRKERQEFQTKLSERDLTINQQAKQLSSFKTIFESFKNKFTSTVDKVASLEDEVDEIDDLTVAQGKSLVEQGGKIEVNLNSITGLKSVDVDYGKKLDTLEPPSCALKYREMVDTMSYVDGVVTAKIDRSRPNSLIFSRVGGGTKWDGGAVIIPVKGIREYKIENMDGTPLRLLNLGKFSVDRKLLLFSNN